MTGIRGASWRDASGKVIVDEACLARRWRLGLCLCCGGALTRPHAIGEGVWICGLCSDGGHIQRPGELRAILTALVKATRA